MTEQPPPVPVLTNPSRSMSVTSDTWFSVVPNPHLLTGSLSVRSTAWMMIGPRGMVRYRLSLLPLANFLSDT
jgi:hypothetical protein